MPTKPNHLPQLQRRAKYARRRKYNKYRDEIREDCQRRCVYCDMHELEAGGMESMTLDHFRPRKQYPKLEHEPTNLVWACSACNQLKGHDWPAIGLPDHETINGVGGYLDPFEVDRKEYFEVSNEGSFKPLRVPAEYMIESLDLNRPFLKYVRHRRDLIYTALSALEKHFKDEIKLFVDVLANPELSDLEKTRWLQDKQQFEAFLEIVFAMDEALSLP